MKHCSVKGCPGIYETKTITHMVQHDGETILIKGVPAEVCSICGDVLLSLETVEHIEQLYFNIPERLPIPRRSIRCPGMFRKQHKKRSTAFVNT